MKSTSIILTLLILPSLTWSQYNDDSHYETFFGRQPSPRAEAMGRSNVSIGGDLGSVMYNPAGLGQLDGLQVYGSTASPFYILDDARYTYAGAGYSVNKYFQFALMYFNIDWNYQNAYNASSDNNDLGTSIYSLAVSTQPIKNLFVGITTNILNSNIGVINVKDPLYIAFFDVGFLYELKISENKHSHQSINFANSWRNVTQAGYSDESTGFEKVYPLPSIIYIGMNYNMSIKKGLLIEKANTFEFLAQIQYQDVYKYEFRDAFSIGGEVKFIEIIALRLGYYYETTNDYGFTEVNKEKLSEFTYGLGIQVPLHRFSKIPLDFKFDYASLSQPSYTKQPPYNEWDNFTSYSVSLTWVINSDRKENSPDSKESN